MRRGKLGQLHLERFTRLEHVGQAAAALDELRKRLTEPTRAAEEDALPVTDVDEAKGLEHHE